MTATEYVILVDNNDQETGQTEKLAAHEQGLLHRAFSVFIFRKSAENIELLIQQRALHKYHSPGLWTNTCCSHPRPLHDTQAEAQRRLQEEMGFSVPLAHAGQFTYRAEFDNGLIEHEFDHVFIGFLDDETRVRVNPEEVHAHEWVELSTLHERLKHSPWQYTEWFQEALNIAMKMIIKE